MAREGKSGRLFGRWIIVLFFAFIVLILGVWMYIQWSGAEGAKWTNKLPVLSSLLNEESAEPDVTDDSSEGDHVQQEKIAELERSLRRKDEKISSLTDEVASLEQQLELKERESPESSEDAYRNVAKMYADMKPERAAAILSQLDQAEAVRILSEQKSETAAAILERMETERAATLTTLLSEGNQ